MAYLKLFTDALEKYRKLNDAEFGRLIRAALTYKATGEEVELMGREELLWDGIKIDIDRDGESYGAVCAKRSEAGKKGAESRWRNNSKNGKCHLPYSKNGQDKDKDKEEDKDKPLRGNSARGAQEPPNIADYGFSPDLEAAVNDWLAYKREQFGPTHGVYQPRGLKSLLTQIKNAAKDYGDSAVIGVIRDSMSSLYAGIIFDRLKRGGAAGGSGGNHSESPKPKRDWGVTYDV